MGFRGLVMVVNGAPINGVANTLDTSINALNKIKFPITKTCQLCVFESSPFYNLALLG